MDIEIYYEGLTSFSLLNSKLPPGYIIDVVDTLKRGLIAKPEIISKEPLRRIFTVSVKEK